MLPTVLDANRLIRHWQRDRPGNLVSARELAQALIQREGTSAIVTPVAIEFLGGTRDRSELLLARAFLNEFSIIDGGRILAEDLGHARRLAETIPRGHFRPRHFADCLIRAIADRLHYGVVTDDTGFPRSLPPRGTGKRRRR
jgi:predicted nucleic acid-binding protein